MMRLAFMPDPVFAAAICLSFAIVSFEPADARAAESDADSAKALQNLETNIEKKRLESEALKATAVKLKGELKSINTSLVEAAGRVQDQEQKVFVLETEHEKLSREARLKEVRLSERGDQFSGVVMALTRMSRVPTEALIVQPMAPEDMVRSAILLRAAVPQLERNAQSLRDDLDGLRFARARVEERRTVLDRAADALRTEQINLKKLYNRKAATRAEAISKNRAALSQMRELAKKASSLRDLLSKIEQSRSELAALSAGGARQTSLSPPTNKQNTYITAPALEGGAELLGSISKARGQLPFPVVGRVIGLYGQDLGSGLSRKGISIKTRGGAQVISPFDGKVVFSGPFRGYGQLLIIDHGEGYHSLLAGLANIDAQLGNPVLAGEPVGTMLEATQDGGQKTDDAPVLYVEFRRNNEPVNPLPWLAARKGNRQG